ncbi:MAG: hypothetical protein J6T15_02660 [Bacilli bacterium]|nr:hypothetical protein [Bacilli bacterium]
MKKKFLLVALGSLLSFTACSEKDSQEVEGNKKDKHIIVGTKEGYEYAKGYKYFDTYLGDEIPTSIDYPGFENAFTYHPEEQYFTLNNIENPEEYKITTQLYFSDIDNDGYKEILINNNRFYKPDPENPSRNLNANIHPTGCWIINLHTPYLVASGMSGASVDYYYYFSIDEKGELVENRFNNTNDNGYIIKTKYFFAVGDKLYKGILQGSEEVERTEITKK